jgi:anti-sigma factor RsiW
MSETPHQFDETLLSGYLDGELTQGDAQRVRLHLEECPDCRNATDELHKLREATMNSEFRVPDDTQWDETPRGAVSRFLHTFGWLIAGLWVVGIGAYLVWQIATGSESLQFEGMLGFGVLLAVGLIILSALIDRLKVRKNDPYRKVLK